MSQDFGPPCTVEANGKRWVRPNSTCYPCDVYGPGCPWHGKDWVEQAEAGEVDLSPIQATGLTFDEVAANLRANAEFIASGTDRVVHAHPVHPADRTPCCGLRLGELPGPGALSTTDAPNVTCRGER